MSLRKSLVGLVAIALLAGCAARDKPRVERTAADHPELSTAGAIVGNIWYTPGRALTCTGGVILAAVVMSVTFGQSYDEGSDILHGACGGPWLIQKEDVK